MNRRMHDWLGAVADRRPENCAIVFREHSTTYGELNRASNQLARALQTAGCIRGDRIALLLNKSPAAVTAIFAALKADCIYVPLDPQESTLHLARALQLCECRCLIAEESTAVVVNTLIENQQLPFCTRIGWLDSGAELSRGMRAQFTHYDIRAFSDKPLPSVAGSMDPAQIMFTAGSAGLSKAVTTTHSNVIGFITWAVEWFGFTLADRISGVAPLHSDLSSFDIFSAVAAGAQLHLAPPEVSVLPHRMVNFIRKSELTQWFSMPSALHQIARLDIIQKNHFPRLRRVLWSREKFPTPSLIYWMRRLPHTSFVNLYGATEATIASCYHRLLRSPEKEKAEIPIGTPCDGQMLHVLDDRLRPTPQGEIGDVYITGQGLSPGYWKDPEKTAENFPLNPFLSSPLEPSSAERMFRTGDLARIGSDGKMYLVGSAESVIVRTGFKLELGEIEVAVQAIPRIQEAAALAITAPNGSDREICCACVPLPGIAMPAAAIQAELARVLPAYMIPSRWLVLDALPRNGNGKIDRSALKIQFTVAGSDTGRARSAGGN